MRNIHLEIIRGGRRFEISAYDIVVGDVVPLIIGNQGVEDGEDERMVAGYSMQSHGANFVFLRSPGEKLMDGDVDVGGEEDGDEAKNQPSCYLFRTAASAGRPSNWRETIGALSLGTGVSAGLGFPGQPSPRKHGTTTQTLL
uniref:Uncharacterized protein n=1 Tax=Quercus lobata TaxID=97700 RepID=A0A7N2L781_QUELO